MHDYHFRKVVVQQKHKLTNVVLSEESRASNVRVTSEFHKHLVVAAQVRRGQPGAALSAKGGIARRGPIENLKHILKSKSSKSKSNFQYEVKFDRCLLTKCFVHVTYGSRGPLNNFEMIAFVPACELLLLTTQVRCSIIEANTSRNSQIPRWVNFGADGRQRDLSQTRNQRILGFNFKMLKKFKPQLMLQSSKNT